MVNDSEYAVSENYWSNAVRMVRAPAPLPIEISVKGPDQGKKQSKYHRIKLSDATSQKLAERRDSYWQLIELAWGLVLHRYCAEETVVFGVIRSTNDRDSSVEAFPRCLRFTKDSLASDCLHDLQRQWETMQPHLHFSQDQIQACSSLPPEIPLFQTLIADKEPAIPDERRLALTLSVSCGDKPGLYLVYDVSKFSEHSMARMAKHLENLLDGIVEDRHETVMQIPFMDPLEKHHVLETLNASAKVSDTDTTYVHAFRERLSLYSDQIAVRFGNLSMTYFELDVWSDRFAAELQQHGVLQGSFVGVMMERSLELAISLLGILKSGAAYLPLDPQFPSSRLALMLNDSQARTVVIKPGTSISLPAGVAVETVTIDLKQLREQSTPPTVPQAELGPDDPAYLIYTSGSTGTPKGVPISHRSLVTHNRAMIDCYGIQAEDNVLQFATINFDISVEEIFPTWLAGATLTFRQNDLGTPSDFLSMLEWEKITVINLPTAYWQEMLSELDSHPMPSHVRMVIVGGEEIPRESYREWKEVVPPEIEFVNGYGPTECTVTATVYKSGSGDESDGVLPIGKPLPFVKAYIIDPYLEPTPLGIPGELCLASPCLTPGYLNNEPLTRSKFIDNPFDAQAEFSRLYRTGDRARFREDGQIEFLGRLDDQVKIRGFRIELGEIESTIASHPTVRDVAVVVQSINGQSSLASFIIPKDNEIEIQSLQGFLTDRLPTVMIPNGFRHLDSFPLSPSGKIDRQALATMPVDVERSAFETPRTEIEHRLLRLWQKILKQDPLSIHDDFFALGGHSLLALRLIGLVKQEFDITLKLGTLLRASTVAQLASILEDPSQAKSEEAPSLTLLTEERPGTPIILVHGGDGGAIFYQRLAEHLTTNENPIYIIESRQLQDAHCRPDSVEQMAQDYVQQLSTLNHDTWILGGYSFGGMVAYEMAKQLTESGQHVSMLTLFDTPNPVHTPRKRNLVERIRYNWQNVASRNPISRFTKLGLRFLDGAFTFTRVGAERTLVRCFERISATTPARWQHLAVREHNDRIAHFYSPQSIPVNTILFRAIDQGDKHEYPEDLGWEDLLGSPIEIHDTPGQHLKIFDPPFVKNLARRFDQVIPRTNLV